MYRSRLQRIEEKRNLRTAVLLILATAGLIGLVVAFGLPLLIRGAVWLGNLKSGSGSGSRDLIPPAPPFLIVPYSATNSASLTVRGSAEPESTVYVVLNGEIAGRAAAGPDGLFELTDVLLREGNNQITATAADADGNRSLVSRTAAVLYLSKQPDLTVESPADNLRVSGSNNRVEIKGSIQAGARVTVNGRVLIVGGDGRFTSSYQLSPGDNNLEFIAQDQAGNVTNLKVKVVYAP